jgi:hypothetical protein
MRQSAAQAFQVSSSSFLSGACLLPARLGGPDFLRMTLANTTKILYHHVIV